MNTQGKSPDYSINKERIAIVVTSPMITKFFLIPHIKYLSKYYDLTLITNMEHPSDFLNDVLNEIKIIDIRIQREISIIEDLSALLKLVQHFRKINYDIVYSITPKGGLLATIAARLSGVPVRIHTFTGQVWATSIGLKKYVLQFMDTLISLMASFILVDSVSQRDYLLSHGIIIKDKSAVLASGSISGVNMERFRPSEDSRRLFRSKMQIRVNDIVFLYLGRLKKDKGIYDLFEAYEKLVKVYPTRTRLVVAGPDEEGILNTLKANSSIDNLDIIFLSYTSKPESVISAADVLCLPSYREGFGNVVLEAASMSIPSICTKIYGLTDAIVEDETGLSVEPGNVQNLFLKMKMMVSDDLLRKELGKNARNRVANSFRESILTNEFKSFLDRKI